MQSVTHASICQSQTAAGPWRYPHAHCQPITRRKSDTPAPPPVLSQRPHSHPPANHDGPIPPTLTGCQWAKSRRFPRAVESLPITQTAPVLSRLANHGESAEHPPRSITSWRSRLLWPRCGLLQSQLRLEAPPTTLYSVAEPSAGARAGAVPLSGYPAWRLEKA